MGKVVIIFNRAYIFSLCFFYIYFEIFALVEHFKYYKRAFNMVISSDEEYKQQEVRRVKDIEKTCKSNEDNLMRASSNLNRQLDQDISQLVTRCENIEKRLQKI